MIRSKDITSVTELRQHLKERLSQVRETNRPLFVIRDGQPEAVVLSPALYDTLAQAYDFDQDLLTMQQSMKEFEEGKGRPADEVFDELRAELLARQAAQSAESHPAVLADASE